MISRTKDTRPNTSVTVKIVRVRVASWLSSIFWAAIAAVAAGFGKGVTESVVAVVVDMKFEDVIAVVVVILVGESVMRDVTVVDPGGGTGKVSVAAKLSCELVVDNGHPVEQLVKMVVPAPPSPAIEIPVPDIQFPDPLCCV